MSDLQLMPQSLEAEEAVLGIIMNDNTTLEECKKYITNSRMFYNETNRRIYQKIAELQKKESEINPITIMASLTENDKKKYDINAYFLTGLLETGMNHQMKDYARIVAEKSLKRKLIKSTMKIQENAFKDNKEFNALVDDVNKVSSEFQSITTGQEFDLEDLISETEDSIYESVNLVKYGFDSLNKMAGGMTRGEITVIGGRPGHGKTTLVVNLCYNLLQQGLKVMMINREMNNKEMMKKLLVLSHKELYYSNIRMGGRNMDEKTINHLNVAMKNFKQYKDQLFMFDKLFTLNDSNAVISKYKPDIILDDYIQLIRVKSQNEGRRFEIEEIMRSYKETAKRYNCIPILVSQLNRNIEARIDKVPKMSDLSEGGSIEQVAENILFVYYEYKDKYSDSELGPEQNQIVAAKVRYGTGGMITMGFNGNKCQFHENMIVRHNKTEVIIPEAFPVEKTGERLFDILND